MKRLVWVAVIGALLASAAAKTEEPPVIRAVVGFYVCGELRAVQVVEASKLTVFIAGDRATPKEIRDLLDAAAKAGKPTGKYELGRGGCLRT